MLDYELIWRLERFGSVACDGCEATTWPAGYVGGQSADIADAMLAEGWRANEDFAYCPRCAKRESLQ